jgi:glycerol-3-phosphate dehydrogenase (NAD(P)+)
MSTHSKPRVGLVGLGNLGSAIGNLVAGNGYDVLGWEYNRAVVDEINRERTNARYLDGVAMLPNLAATSDLAEVASTSALLFIALPSAFIQPTLQPVRHLIPAETIIINMAKGIDGVTGLTSFQTVTGMFPQHRCVMLSGPSIANEFARGMPTIVVLAGQEVTDLVQVARVLDAAHFRTRFSHDAMGVELGGLLKNIYAIGLGIFDGRQIDSVNFRSVYLTIALEEMTKIGVALGAQAETFAYLPGMGDLLATSLSPHSHNRHLGERLSQGWTLDAIRAEMGVLPEGFNTIRIMLNIAEKMHVSLPLARALWDVIHGRLEAEHFIFAFIRDFVEE